MERGGERWRQYRQTKTKVIFGFVRGKKENKKKKEKGHVLTTANLQILPWEKVRVATLH